jgi:EAL domain-containing protein (putative c-di-GMP-specific phosphodiesterase class I)
VYREHGNSSVELLRAADAAMYHAKRGREGVRVYDAGTETGAHVSSLAAGLLIAIETDQIELDFQPEYELATDAVVGVEALARWRTGDTTIPPSQFIPLAEQTGLICQLTHLTLRKALDQARAWRDAGVGVPVSVNLSAQLVTDRSLQAEVTAMLAERGLDGTALVLEITETTVINDLDVAVQVLQGLRGIGVRIELDDFGSGYASFKALHDLPLDGVKIDRDLVNDFDTGGRSLLAATIDIGRRLGLKVVAEGIEDERSLEQVRQLGADTAQGYYLARPMSPEAIQALLSRNPLTTTPIASAPRANVPRA